jgi:hypothetical protein
MTTPALENRLAAHRACGRYTRRRLHGRCAPFSRCVRTQLCDATRRCRQRRFSRGVTGTALSRRVSDEGAAALGFVSALRNVCARLAPIGARHSRQRGRVSASSCLSGAAIRPHRLKVP